MATQKCSQCNAPLPAAAPGAVAVCPFCAAENRVQDFRPPPRRPAEPTRRRGGGAGVAIVLLVAMAGLVAGVYFLRRRFEPSGATSGGATATGGSSEPGLLPADLAKLAVDDWQSLDLSEFPGRLDAVDVPAGLGWARDRARAWSPDARLSLVSVDSVRHDGGLDVTEVGGGAVRYRFWSPARRAAAQQLAQVSETPSADVLRIELWGGQGRVSAQAYAGRSDERIEDPDPVAICPMGALIGKLEADGLQMRPKYSFMMTSRQGVWTWWTNMTDIDHRESTNEACAVEPVAPPPALPPTSAPGTSAPPAGAPGRSG